MRGGGSEGYCTTRLISCSSRQLMPRVVLLEELLEVPDHISECPPQVSLCCLHSHSCEMNC